ncbi:MULTISPECIES: hypothetical protein [Ensifer]|jgi:hypothetical protein|nr:MULTISPECIES: hypothetical protein [Ensifer]MDP9630846.1 hypothetical protein [Ensifer adhaerens]
MKYHIPAQIYLFDYRGLFAWIALSVAVFVVITTILFGRIL